MRISALAIAAAVALQLFVEPLFAAGRISNAYAISKLARSETESELDRTSIEIAFEAKRAYLECVEARKLEDVASETVQQLEAHLKDVQAMSEAGLATNTDLLDAEVLLTGSKTNFRTLTIEYLIAQADLERATGGTQ